jgi:hypothetical protein
MVALILETLAVLLLAYIVICKKPIKIEFTINLNNSYAHVGQESVPALAKEDRPDPFAMVSEEEKKYYEESMNMISVINRVLSGENIEDIIPKKPEVRE